MSIKMDDIKKLNYKDIGYLINDNYTEGTYYRKVIYPKREDYDGYFCLLDSKMTKEQTMIDITPNWKEELEARDYAHVDTSFENLYNIIYTKIDNFYYKNITISCDLIIYEKDTKYEKYKNWFCPTKELFLELWAKIKDKELQKLRKQFYINE